MSRTSALVVALASVASAACGSRSTQVEYPVLPRNVRESVHRDHPDCRGREIRGLDLGNGYYRVLACGLDVVYVCPVGPHSRWRPCYPDTRGGAATAAGSSQPTSVIIVTPNATSDTASAAQGTQSAGVAGASSSGPIAGGGDATTSPVPTREEVEIAIRQWLDANRATILGCTGTAAAVVEVRWNAHGTPTIRLEGSLHRTPGERCVIQALSNAQFQVGGQAGRIQHVVQ